MKTELTVYLLVGKEQFLKDEFIRDLRAKIFLKSSDTGFNYEEFTAGKNPLGSILDFLKTAPFLAERRLAIFHDIDRLKGEEKELLEEYVKSPSLTGILALVSDEGSVKKDAYLKRLSEHANLVQCYAPFDRDFPSWIEMRARKNGKILDREAVRALLEKKGKNLSELATSIEQLAIYAGDRPAITSKDIEVLLGRSAEGDVYTLVDRIVEKDARKSFEILELLYREGIRFQEIVGALAGQLDRLKEAQVLLGERRSPQEIGAALGIHPFYLDRLLIQARKVSAQLVKESVKKLLFYDESVKTGRLGDRIALERFIVELCA